MQLCGSNKSVSPPSSTIGFTSASPAAAVAREELVRRVLLQQQQQQRDCQGASPVPLNNAVLPSQNLVNLAQPSGLVSDAARAQLLRLIALRQQDQEETYQRQIRDRVIRQMGLVGRNEQPAPPAEVLPEASAFVPLKATCVSPTVSEQSSAAAVVEAKETPAKRAKQAADEKSKEKGIQDPSATKKKDTKWLAMLDKLKSYKEVHGDCIVPRGYASDPQLASWYVYTF